MTAVSPKLSGGREDTTKCGAAKPHAVEPVWVANDLFRVFRAWALVIFTVVFLAMGGAGIASLFSLPIYEANASLFSKFGREYVYRQDFGQQSWAPFKSAEILNSELEILNGRPLKEKVLDGLGIAAIYPKLVTDPGGVDPTGFMELTKASVKDALKAAIESVRNVIPVEIPEKVAKPDRATLSREKAIMNITANLSIKSPKDSNVIHLSFQHPDPKVAEAVLARLIEAYYDERLRLFRDDRGAVINEQIAKFKKQMEFDQKYLQAFKQKYRISDVQSQISTNISRDEQLAVAIQSLQVQILTLRQRAAGLEQSDQVINGKLPVSAFVNQEIIKTAMDHWLQLQLREQEMLATFGPKNPTIQALRQSMDGIKSYLEGQRRLELGRMNAEIGLKQSELTSLQSTQTEVRRELDRLTASVNTLKNLERNAEQSSSNLELFRQKAEEAELENAYDKRGIMSVQTLGNPAASFVPVGLSRMMRVMLAGFAGFLFAIVVAAYLERRRVRAMRQAVAQSEQSSSSQEVCSVLFAKY